MNIFNWLLIIFWLGFWLYWAVSAQKVKKVVFKENPKVRYLGLLLVMIVIVLSQRLGLNAKFSSHNEIISVLGLSLCVLGLALAVWARVHLGKNWNIEPSIQEGHELVTSGPYSFVRHPIYTGMITAFFGSALIGGLAWVIMFIFVSAVFIMRIKIEEGLMMQLFPQAYPEYKKRTKALIPFIW